MNYLKYVVEESSIPFDDVGNLLTFFIEKGFSVYWGKETDEIIRLNISSNNLFKSALLFKRDYRKSVLIIPKGKIRINNEIFSNAFEEFAVLFNINCDVYEKIDSEYALIKIIKNGKLIIDINKDKKFNEGALNILIDYMLFELNEKIEESDTEGIKEIEEKLLLLVKDLNYEA